MSSPANNARRTAAAERVVSAPATREQTPRAKCLGKIEKPIARASRLGRQAAGVSGEQLALVLGTSQSRVAEWEVDHKPEAPTTRHLFNPAAPVEWVHAIAAGIGVIHDFQVVPTAEIEHGDNHFARIAALKCDLPHAIADALSDNHLSDAELERLQTQARERAKAALEVEAWATAELARRRDERAKR